MGFGNGGEGEEWFDVDRMWQGAMDGLLEGVVSIGLNYSVQELGVNPLLANIGFSALSSLASIIGDSITDGTQNIEEAFDETVDSYGKVFTRFFGGPEEPEKAKFYYIDSETEKFGVRSRQADRE